MHRSRASLYYLFSYLTATGLALMFAPALTLKLMFARGDYGDVFPRFAGVLMLALGLVILQVIRHRVEPLYPATLVVRSTLWLFVLWLYTRTSDPFFAIVLAVVGAGVALTGTSVWLDKREIRQDRPR
jgi:uncharacterized protein YjeT (DUF2065 family)